MKHPIGCFIFSKCYISRHIDVPLKSHLLTSFCVRFHFFLMMFRGRTLLRLFISLILFQAVTREIFLLTELISFFCPQVC